MDVSTSTLELCIAGTQAEYAGRLDDARAFYHQAWLVVASDWDACVAAHYLGRCQEDAAQSLHWHLTALEHAGAVDLEKVAGFYPSLYVNLGRAYERLGDSANARHYYDLASSLGLDHHSGSGLDQLRDRGPISRGGTA